MKTVAASADELVGTYRTFGVYGPNYEVVQKTPDTLVHMVVTESCPKLDPAVE